MKKIKIISNKDLDTVYYTIFYKIENRHGYKDSIYIPYNKDYLANYKSNLGYYLSYHEVRYKHIKFSIVVVT